MHKRIALQIVLKFTLKWLHHVLVCSPSSGSALYEFAKVTVFKTVNKNTLVWLIWWCGCAQPHHQINYTNVFLLTVLKTVTLANSYSALPDDGECHQNMMKPFSCEF